MNKSLDDFIITCESNIIYSDDIATEAGPGDVALAAVPCVLLGVLIKKIINDCKSSKGATPFTKDEIYKLLNDSRNKSFKIATNPEQYLNTIRPAINKYMASGKGYLTSVNSLIAAYKSSGVDKKLLNVSDYRQEDEILKNLPDDVVNKQKAALAKAKAFSSDIDKLVSETKLDIKNVEFRDATKDECMKFVKQFDNVFSFYEAIDKLYYESEDMGFGADPDYKEITHEGSYANNHFYSLFGQVLNLIKIKK